MYMFHNTLETGLFTILIMELLAIPYKLLQICFKTYMSPPGQLHNN